MNMKATSLLASVLFFPLASPAQITLEQTYPNAGYNHSTYHDQFFLWNFEASGSKYVKIDRTSFTITLYNMDHTVYKVISYADAPTTASNAYVMYISEHLFDLDDDVEYLYSTFGGSPETLFTRVYDEDGTVLLNADSCSLFVYSTVHQQQFPIMNTPDGTKLILSHWTEASARVYRLPGTLACSACEDGVSLGMGGGDQVPLTITGELFSYPNPAQENMIIHYELPVGVTEGEMVIVDGSGRAVLRRPVNATASSTTVNTAMLAAGTYMYHLYTAKGVVQGPKVIVVK
jgi:hypothetical protein